MGQTAAQGEAYWRVHVEAWRSSGQSRADYCTAHGLSRKTFGWWAWRVGREGPGAPRGPFLAPGGTGGGGPDEGTPPPPPGGGRLENGLPGGVAGGGGPGGG